MQLRDVMTSDVLTTTPDASVSEASSAMMERGIGSACVVDEAGGLIGILTERDVLRAAASGHDLTTEPARQWMSPDPVTCDIDELLSRAAGVLQQHNFRHIPVTSAGRLVGIVSMRDVWRYAFLPEEPDDLVDRT